MELAQGRHWSSRRVRRQHFLQKILRAAVVATLTAVGLAPSEASAQTKVLSLPPKDFNNHLTEFYRLRWNTTTSVWDTTVPFRIAESVKAGPFGFGPDTLGKFFTVDLPLVPTFRVGAGIDYNLHFGAALNLDAGVDAGSVLADYPFDVEIEYPDPETILPGEAFVVKTSYRPEATASFFSTGPTFKAELRAKTDFDALLAGAVLPGTKVTVIDKSVHDNRPLFSLSDHFDSAVPKAFSCCDVPLAGIVNGTARRPILGGQGARGDSSHPNSLVSFVPDDDFLFAGIGLTNFVSNALIGLPLTDTVDLGLGDLEYHILELDAGLAAGVHQELRLDPHPMIRFRMEDENRTPLGTTAPVEVGQNVEFTAPPAGGALRLVPFIDKRGVFSNDTHLQATPAIRADPFRIAFHGDSTEVFGIDVDVPSFSLNPGRGPFTLPFPIATFDLATYSSQVPLTDDTEPTVSGRERIITADTRPPVLVNVCRERDPGDDLDLPNPGPCSQSLPPGANQLQVFAMVRRAPPDDVFLVNGGPTTSTFVRHRDGGDTYKVDIPAAAVARQGAVRLQVATPGAFNIWYQTSNPVDMTVLWAAAPAPNLNPSVFVRQFDGVQNFGDVCGDAPFGAPQAPPVDQTPTDPVHPPGGVLGTDNPLFQSPCASEVLTAGGGMLGVGLDTSPLQSAGVPVEWLDPKSLLTLDDVPLPTLLGSTTTSVDQGGTTVYSTGYQLFALIPSTLQSLGGSHKLALVNAGINATEPFSMDLLLDYPTPRLNEMHKLATADTPYGSTRLELTGTGFTPRSVVLWDGIERPVNFRSRSVLLLDLTPGDPILPGTHTVSVVNPAPGGGSSNSAIYSIAPEGTPQLQLRSSLFCSTGNRIGGVLTVSNIGTGPLRGARITNVVLDDGTRRLRVATPLPIGVPETGTGEANSVIVSWSSCSVIPGQSGTVIVDLLLATGPLRLTAPAPTLPCASVRDVTPPVISGVPSDITVAASNAHGTRVTYPLPHAVDAVSGVVPVTCSPASGTIFPLGTTKVKCTAIDAAGNVASAFFRVTVRKGNAWSMHLERVLRPGLEPGYGGSGWLAKEG